MVDGAASLMTMTYAFHQLGWWHEEHGVNILDTGAHFYEVYATADDKWFAVGAIEAHFYAELLRVMGLEDADLPGQNERDKWPEMKTALRRGVPRQDPRRVDGRLRRHRRLRRSGAVAVGGPHPPACRRPQHLRRGGRRGPARSGAPVQPHALSRSDALRR